MHLVFSFQIDQLPVGNKFRFNMIADIVDYVGLIVINDQEVNEQTTDNEGKQQTPEMSSFVI